MFSNVLKTFSDVSDVLKMLSGVHRCFKDILKMTSRCFQDADKMFSFVVDFCLNPIPPSSMKISPNRQFRKCVLLTSMPQLKDTVPIPECRYC